MSGIEYGFLIEDTVNEDGENLGQLYSLRLGDNSVMFGDTIIDENGFIGIWFAPIPPNVDELKARADMGEDVTLADLKAPLLLSSNNIQSWDNVISMMQHIREKLVEAESVKVV